jgi:hypothetical protein
MMETVCVSHNIGNQFGCGVAITAHTKAFSDPYSSAKAWKSIWLQCGYHCTQKLSVILIVVPRPVLIRPNEIDFFP